MQKTSHALCTALLLIVGAGGVAQAESEAGLKWTAPPGWASQGAATFRVVTWKVQDAECIVYFFGPGQGGSVEANLDRWKGQFSQNGKPAEAKITRRTIHGISMTTIDLTGTYIATGGQVKEGQGPQPNYRMIATVTEGKTGNLFIRFIGPAKTVSAELPKYEQLLASFQRD
jgi:hypothetical protein